MEMIDQHGLEKPVSTQLWGDDPETMAAAAKVVRECGADIVDINFGCPAPKVTKTNGGSACLRDVDRCEAIMKAVVDAVDCPVTMKMRLGWTEDNLVYVDVARRAQHVGIQAVTLHARTARQFYKGSANWEHIKRLKASVDIPVIGNGDLDDPHAGDGTHARNRRRCDHARSRDARKSVADFADSRFDGRPRSASRAAGGGPSALMHRALQAMVDELGESRAVPQMRKHVALYLKGIPGAAILRERIMHIDRAGEVVAVIEDDDRRLEVDSPWLRRDQGSMNRSEALYGAATPQELVAEAFDELTSNYVNPPLARVMKLSGSPVEVRAQGMHDLGSQRQSVS